MAATMDSSPPSYGALLPDPGPEQRKPLTMSRLISVMGLLAIGFAALGYRSARPSAFRLVGVADVEETSVLPAHGKHGRGLPPHVYRAGEHPTLPVSGHNAGHNVASHHHEHSPASHRRGAEKEEDHEIAKPDGKTKRRQKIGGHEHHQSAAATRKHDEHVAAAAHAAAAARAAAKPLSAYESTGHHLSAAAQKVADMMAKLNSKMAIDEGAPDVYNGPEFHSNFKAPTSFTQSSHVPSSGTPPPPAAPAALPARAQAKAALAPTTTTTEGPATLPPLPPLGEEYEAEPDAPAALPALSGEYEAEGHGIRAQVKAALAAAPTTTTEPPLAHKKQAAKHHEPAHHEPAHHEPAHHEQHEQPAPKHQEAPKHHHHEEEERWSAPKPILLKSQVEAEERAAQQREEQQREEQQREERAAKQKTHMPAEAAKWFSEGDDHHATEVAAGDFAHLKRRQAEGPAAPAHHQQSRGPPSHVFRAGHPPPQLPVSGHKHHSVKGPAARRSSEEGARHAEHVVVEADGKKKRRHKVGEKPAQFGRRLAEATDEAKKHRGKLPLHVYRAGEAPPSLPVSGHAHHDAKPEGGHHHRLAEGDASTHHHHKKHKHRAKVNAAAADEENESHYRRSETTATAPARPAARGHGKHGSHSRLPLHVYRAGEAPPSLPVSGHHQHEAKAPHHHRLAETPHHSAHEVAKGGDKHKKRRKVGAEHEHHHHAHEDAVSPIMMAGMFS